MAEHRARPMGVLLIAGILLFAAVVVAIYWILFFSGAQALSGVPCYMTFQTAFPAADAWLATTALVGAIGLLTRKSWGVLFALLGGSASIYLGLMDVLYGKLYSPAGTDVAVEIAINALTLTLGPAIIWYVWSRRHSLF